ncbi:UNVERIFIED_CONTAM: hypothetical protein GTU68_003846 [Idotea baltica]|nr:hypothetical protein [Idotea baltica]
MNRAWTINNTSKTVCNLLKSKGFSSNGSYGTRYFSAFKKDNIQYLKTLSNCTSRQRWQTNSNILFNSNEDTTKVTKALFGAFHTSCTKWQEAVAVDSSKEEHQFQAETRMLLDIVARSLYSDKEVFIRELVSNASDALEKLRCLNIQETSSDASSAPLKVTIETDKYAKTLTITDTGIGMGKEELINNLGTIARSGSKEFLQHSKKDGVDPQNIIGQFGVGFYSTFMVADKVEVYTRSHQADSHGYCWSSDGSGKYTVEEKSELPVGTKIICHLKTDCREFADEQTVKNILTKYSSFVSFPIELNGAQANTIEPMWLKDPKQVSPEEQRVLQVSMFLLRHAQVHSSLPNRRSVNLRCLLYFPEGKTRFVRREQRGRRRRVALLPQSLDSEQGGHTAAEVAQIHQGCGGQRGHSAELEQRDAAELCSHPQAQDSHSEQGCSVPGGQGEKGPRRIQEVHGRLRNIS